MDELTKFSLYIKSQIQDNESLDINDAREIVKAINDFLYTNYEGIGHTSALGKPMNICLIFINTGRSIMKKFLIAKSMSKSANL